ncbi:hypothetical protein AQI88_34695 [Streptomyces cellostaticus]|uniref:Uncharacterized protein n=1 Tax=Streptomyces cellostaticus TaxID=67285 RepID=A0A101NFD4_9ACTN|nr:hypothetical protein [Streptomyces cellostaticus]KUM91936.1 hypothetical protein AQI88_34695 [Streptomyces cellostaticus]GHI06909.1 hypothetical protein Scel_52300 [Streptomyces cellostaticus]
MTQSGQGEEPSARPAHEGIVLPSDGGEPLLPGMTGTPAPVGPAGGQAWGGQWGPGRQQAPQPDQGWPAAAGQQWGTPEQQPPSGNGPGPLPPEGAPAPSYGGQTYGSGGQEPAYSTGGQNPAYGSAGQDPAYGSGGHQPQYGGGHQPQYGGGQQPAYGDPAPYQQQYPAPPAPAAAAPLPPAASDAYPAQSAPPGLPQAAPLPPTAEGATQYLPPVPSAGSGGIPAPAPAAADEGATQYLPPVPAAPAAEGATQYLPPVPAAPADEGATQYIPPVVPGALPPETAGEETRYLGRVQQPSAPAAHSDAEATQYIPPYTGQAPGGERQPPAEFDNLFRSGPGGAESPAGATQQMPRIQQPNAYPGPAQPSHSAPLDEYEDEGGRGGRSRSRVPLIAAVGVGIVVLGVGVGALLSSGGGDKGNDNKTVAASGPATQDSASAAADPAKQQAVALDGLLADSGSSRASVIQAVANVKRCNSLDQSASDLRDAAKQRGDLVTRLGKLSVDKLPGNAELTAALTKAWQASAAADNHYAAWADQVGGGKKGCHKGQARITGQTQAGNRESGTASAQKVKAAALWNAIATKYGLTRRQPTQL